MSFFNYTYTFSNGSTADATQVNQNFSDVKNGFTDGTHDASVNALSVAGAASLQGSVQLGSSSTPTVTWNASLNTSIPLSTNTSFDIGSSTLGLRSVYIGGTSSFTTRILGAATVTWTLTLPTTAGTGGNFLTTDGTGVLSWVALNEPQLVQNLGIAATVATNALTIALKTSTGADPSSSSPVTLSFRNSTLATGQYASASQTAALSIVVPSSATLGQTSNISQYVWVYLINDAGTLDLAVSGVQVFFDTTTQSSTQISSGSTSGTVLYSSASHSGAKPIRLIGRLLVSEATAGTWASAPSEIALMPVPQLAATEWAAYTPTLTGYGTATALNFMWRRAGALIDVRGTFTSGTVSGTIGITLPNGVTTASATIIPTNQIVGFNVRALTSTLCPMVIASASTTIGVGNSTDGMNVYGSGPNSSNNAEAHALFAYGIPVAGYSNYGP